MSASLVGSEMCIRDSKGDAYQIPVRAGQNKSLVGPPHGTPGLGRATSRAGLLYTSDAADDM
eukprot:11441972-Alexandrium_andersonii.AAC.1